MWQCEGEKRGREDLESRLRRGRWMRERKMKEEVEIMMEGRPSLFWCGLSASELWWRVDPLFPGGVWAQVNYDGE